MFFALFIECKPLGAYSTVLGRFKRTYKCDVDQYFGTKWFNLFYLACVFLSSWVIWVVIMRYIIMFNIFSYLNIWKVSCFYSMLPCIFLYMYMKMHVWTHQWSINYYYYTLTHMLVPKQCFRWHFYLSYKIYCAKQLLDCNCTTIYYI